MRIRILPILSLVCAVASTIGAAETAKPAKIELRANEVWLVAADGATKQLTRDGREKRDPVISPDETKILVPYSDLPHPQAGHSYDVNILDVAGRVLLNCVVEDFGSMPQYRWVTGERFCLQSHVGPSAGDYLGVYSTTNGKVLGQYLGGEFSWNPTGTHVAYAGGSSPDGHEDEEHEELRIDADGVYRVAAKRGDGGELVSNFLWDGKGQTIRFVEQTRANAFNLVTLKVTFGEKKTKATVVEKKPIPVKGTPVRLREDERGKIAWDTEAN